MDGQDGFGVYSRGLVNICPQKQSIDGGDGFHEELATAGQNANYQTWNTKYLGMLSDLCTNMRYMLNL